MDELQELKKRLEEERPMVWDGFPDIGLYMDQIISYAGRQLISFEEKDNLTPAMVNNYIKAGLLPRADGKKYTKPHLAYLTAICALKQVLSVKETQALVASGADGHAPENVYGAFYEELSMALDCTAEILPQDIPKDQLPRLALRLALRSYADKLACQRILGMMEVPEDTQPKKKK